MSHDRPRRSPGRGRQAQGPVPALPRGQGARWLRAHHRRRLDERSSLVAAPSLTSSGGVQSAAAAFAMAGLAPSDIDLAEIYDNFTISVIVQLEDMGFCKKGEGGPFVEAGHIDLGGRLPVNLHGGLHSEAPPGRPGGIFHLIEAVLQLRGACGPRQMANARTALVNGVGGIMSNHATVILGRT